MDEENNISDFEKFIFNKIKEDRNDFETSIERKKLLKKISQTRIPEDLHDDFLKDYGRINLIKNEGVDNKKGHFKGMSKEMCKVFIEDLTRKGLLKKKSRRNFEILK